MDDKEINRQYPGSGGKDHGATGAMRLIWLIALMVLVGCSGEEAASQGGSEDGTAIAFSCNMQEETAVTRAGLEETAVTRAGLEEKLPAGSKLFTIYGFKNTGEEGTGTGNYTTYQTVFPGYTVNYGSGTASSSTTNSSDWEYVGQELLGQDEQTVKFWDWSAKAYRFFGITKRYDQLDGKIVDGVFKLTFTADVSKDAGIAAIPYYSHLWFSNNNYDDYPTRQYGQPVQLEFLRPLCEVRFMFIFEDPQNDRSNTDLEDMNFHRSDGVTIKQKGKVTISYPLTGTGKTETCAFDVGASGITGFTRDYRENIQGTTENEEDHFWYTVLPIAGQGAFTLDVTVDGEPKSTVVPAQFMDWLPGYRYTYIFKVHVDGNVTIDAVQSAFTGWDVKSGDFTVYNW